MRRTRLGPAEVARTVNDQFAYSVDRFFSLLADLVEIESGPDAPDGVARVESIIAERLSPLDGVSVERRHEHGVDHVAVTIPGGDTRVALLGHADTVFPVGTVARTTLRVEGARCYGPGVADMKGGLAMATLVCEQLARLGGHPTIDYIVVGDEETRVVPPPFMDRLKRADVCFVLECGRPGGGYIVRRKGGFWARLSAIGRPAHAGVSPERGESAIVALCRAVIEVAGINRAREHLTVSVGTIRGGSAPNVVAADAWAEVDVRSFDGEDLDWARGQIRRAVRDTGVTVTETGHWPAMTQIEDNFAAGYEAAGQSLSVALEPQATGGMSDGCWTAAAGIPTVDGVGPEGGDDHTPGEFIDPSSVSARAGILAGAIHATTTRGGTT